MDSHLLKLEVRASSNGFRASLPTGRQGYQHRHREPFKEFIGVEARIEIRISMNEFRYEHRRARLGIVTDKRASIHDGLKE